MLFAMLLMLAPQEGATTPPPAEGAATTEEPKKICRTMALTGSRIGRTKVCKTKEQWAAIDPDYDGPVDVVGNHAGTGRAADLGPPRRGP